MSASTTNYQAMGKEELRSACRVAGISYSKLNNDGMRAELAEKDLLMGQELSHLKFEAPAETEEVTPSNVMSSMFGQLGVTPALKIPVPTVVTRVVDGKKVSADAQPSPQSNTPRSEQPSAPSKVLTKGYKIEKDREQRNGVKRPSLGTVCGDTWAAFDANPTIRANELNTLADSHNWNRTNVSCEFYNWRKFNGIKGRQA